jgi:hypothetical protein
MESPKKLMDMLDGVQGDLEKVDLDAMSTMEILQFLDKQIEAIEGIVKKTDQIKLKLVGWRERMLIIAAEEKLQTEKEPKTIAECEARIEEISHQMVEIGLSQEFVASLTHMNVELSGWCYGHRELMPKVGGLLLQHTDAMLTLQGMRKSVGVETIVVLPNPDGPTVAVAMSQDALVVLPNPDGATVAVAIKLGELEEDRQNELSQLTDKLAESVAKLTKLEEAELADKLAKLATDQLADRLVEAGAELNKLTGNWAKETADKLAQADLDFDEGRREAKRRLLEEVPALELGEPALELEEPAAGRTLSQACDWHEAEAPACMGRTLSSD